MHRGIVSVVAIAILIVVLQSHGDAQVPTRGRIDRVMDVREFSDFRLYLPNSTETFAIYVQWSNSGVVVADDVTLLCLRGPDGIFGHEDDDITLSSTRAVTYRVRPGRLWYTTTVRGQRCWITLDFQHKDQYDLSAVASFNLLIGEYYATEERWPDASAVELHEVEQKLRQWRSGQVVD